ncbi:hypothetical protein GBA52_014565 [Prunus armeniaca]|nr:hypothetical protein GBA52_014565 [Prunus armeniaca]
MASSSPVLDITSINHIIYVRLESDNYPTWLAQIVPVLCSHRLFCFVDGSCQSPPLTILDPKAKNNDSSLPSLIPKPKYDDWV